MNERQIANMSEQDAWNKGCYTSWFFINKPAALFSEKDRQAWIRKVQQEKLVVKVKKK